MTHTDWINAVVTFVAALAGGIGGSFIVWWTARSANANAREIAAEDQRVHAVSLDKQLQEQSKQARADRRAQALLAADERANRLVQAGRERELDREEQRDAIARRAAADLLGRIGDLDSVLSELPALRAGSTFEGSLNYTSSVAAQVVRGPFLSFKRGLRTELLLINNPELVSRYRTLARLADELATSDLGNDIVTNRAIVDVTNYCKFVLISLRQFIDGEELVGQTAAPVLRRNLNDGANWQPIEIPTDWDQI
ncbi:hypothetical protein [Streptacidiphilus sp. MAP12-16]|uniref:hypothetical protein n=1 Tax=Streptacidiphilus sp. MAP12-16 TaxID=3156300 RepID=UPI003513F791